MSRLSNFATVKEATHMHFEDLYTKEEETDPSHVQELLDRISSLVTIEENVDLLR
jgi:hypothetical protein